MGDRIGAVIRNSVGMRVGDRVEKLGWGNDCGQGFILGRGLSPSP